MIESFDIELFKLINISLSNSFFDGLMPMLRDKSNWIPLYVIALLVLLKKYGLKGFAIVLFAVITVSLTDQVSSNLIKPFFGRYRPCNNLLIQDQINVLVNCGVGKSFTSSHAANHFGLAFFFSFLYRSKLLFALLFVWAFSISFAQIYVGVHYPIDILGGVLVGLIISYLTSLIFKRIFTGHHFPKLNFKL